MLEIIIPAGASVYGRQPLAILGQKGDDVQAVLDSFAPKAPAAADVSL
jgi:hypothetical protein